jgi:hypothetical protein
MKKVLTALAALLVSVSAYAQGQVNFRTHIASDTPPIDFKILNSDGSLAANALAQLFVKNGDGSFTPGDVVGTVNAAGYVSAGVANFAIAQGTTVNMVLRAWQGAAGSTFDSSPIHGESAPFSITFAVAPNPPGDLLTLGTGTMTLVPEPTTLALGAVGLGALLIRRRKA